MVTPALVAMNVPSTTLPMLASESVYDQAPSDEELGAVRTIGLVEKLASIAATTPKVGAIGSIVTVNVLVVAR